MHRRFKTPEPAQEVLKFIMLSMFAAIVGAILFALFVEFEPRPVLHEPLIMTPSPALDSLPNPIGETGGDVSVDVLWLDSLRYNRRPSSK